ncbi:MAG: 2-amino-4-hydroxy-6-hydroxymethyldihydropteridine diphosphokinase [Termitinemataceae bacterium]|jgi:2-amino-4-hydroxy-6-hydroxymethyldihydropteridine diphosphokinase|nr:MAG: 2-amino-4-hydroxy-6-hydroxymethyldihydropteridine diphosphokinase [Termitinemataceae bacterium]
MIKVVLGLGSNKGDSRYILRCALEKLNSIFTEFRTASVYRTKPMHIETQPDFYNTACTGKTNETPLSLLEKIHIIETEYGRDRAREQRWGQRCLDIDILWVEGLILNEPELEIPHPRLAERRFALEPLLELEPDAQDPVSLEPYHKICSRLEGQGVKKLN